MKIIDGTGIVMGRLASHVAKELLRGEEISIINSNKVIITGNRVDIEKEFLEKRGRRGSTQKGPKHLNGSDRILKRTIRGMLPDHREGRGKDAMSRLKCYTGMPKELEGKKVEKMKKQEQKIKTHNLERFSR